MSLQRYCHVIATLLPCYCHAIAMLLPCYCHDIAMLLQHHGHAIAVLLPCIRPCYRHVMATILQCYCHVVASLLPNYCHAISELLPCDCRAIAMLLPCYCHAIAMLSHWPLPGCCHAIALAIATPLPSYCPRCCNVIAMSLPCYRPCYCRAIAALSPYLWLRDVRVIAVSGSYAGSCLRCRCHEPCRTSAQDRGLGPRSSARVAGLSRGLGASVARPEVRARVVGESRAEQAVEVVPGRPEEGMATSRGGGNTLSPPRRACVSDQQHLHLLRPGNGALGSCRKPSSGTRGTRVRSMVAGNAPASG